MCIRDRIIGTSLENDKRSAIQGSISEISPTLHCELYTVNIEDKTVWVIDVPSGKDKPYIFSGSIFVREGANSQKLRTVEEMRSFFQECNKIFFDAIPCSWFNIYTDADEQAIKDFRTEAQLSPSTADKQIFENLELFTDKGVAKNGAAMFFGKQPERKFPHAITRCVLFKGTTKVFIIDDKSFGGPLYQQYLQAMTWLESKLQVAYKIEDVYKRQGYELRNPGYKGCTSPKDITRIQFAGKKNDACFVFEGFMDYLSFLTIRHKNSPIYPCIDWQDYIILNSTANVDKALYPLGEYEKIHCLLDNDEAGRKATQAIQKEYGWRVRDASHLYSGHKDLNDYLCQKSSLPEKQTQSAKQPNQEEKNKQSPGEKRKRGRRL